MNAERSDGLDVRWRPRALGRLGIAEMMTIWQTRSFSFAEGRRYFAAAAAACSIRRATTSGWEMNATWLALTSLVLAFIRFA